MQQGPAGSGGEEEEQLSTRRASPWWERPARCREGLENQPSAHWDLPGSGQRVLSLQLWQPEHIVFHHGHGAAPGMATTEGSSCQGLHTWHIQASTDGKYKIPDIKGAENHHAALLSLVDRN